MSTKIYSGYLLSGDMTQWGDIAPRLREQFLPLMCAEYARDRIVAATALLDTYRATKENDPDDPLLDIYLGTPLNAAAISTLHNDIKRVDSQYRPFDCEVIFLSDPDTDDKYGLLFTNRDAYVQKWESLEGVEPYPYWDNADQPDDIDDEEWDMRRRVWERVLPTGVAPITIGMTWRLLGADGLPTSTTNDWVVDHPEEAAAAIPSRAQRASRLAFARVDSESPDDYAAVVQAARELAPSIEPSLGDITIEMLLDRFTTNVSLVSREGKVI